MNFIKANIIPFFLGILGLVLIIIGIIQTVSKSPQKQPLAFEESQPQDKPESFIMVDIEGAVQKPGVYKMPLESRVVDCLAAAGGLSEEADREYVQKNINLAKKATDGLKIYIPRVGEEIRVSDSGPAGGVLNINTAGVSDLETLPGIGEVTAQKIIDARPYVEVSELLSRKILGQSVFEQIKDKVSAD